MSCDFCNTYDFTSIAVRENNVHLAGGSSRYTDPAVNRGRYKLFQFCPLCGSPLLYESTSDNVIPARSNTPVKVAVDCYGQRIPFAIEDDDCVMTEEDYYAISDLKADCGVNFSLAKDAYMYAKRRNGDYKMMVAYCKAKVCTVKLDEPLDKRVQKFMELM